MAKRLTEKQKSEIAEYFKNGKTIEALSEDFNCTSLTITRNLKKKLGEVMYKELVEINTNADQLNTLLEKDKKKKNDFELSKKSSKNEFSDDLILDSNQSENNIFSRNEFIEISPLNFEIDNVPRKELSSIPIQEIDFPKTVYMIVDKNIELEIKLLKDYPEWEFLPNEDLQRKTIEIYFDLKLAKRACSKEQKVIKVPNADVFRIVSPILISRGISRIVSAEKLIAL
ncbi:conserved hypothetical protein [Prochlorococcus marinus str. MIT 9312]|uniref:Uncharacterized protein n=1 Tax=Prochlorococcus marinus (strain MIT 9312) TaxID=74546 RepID=Q319U0_PROM9|nr:hypothetical protein [Prochlorococcus marinus]ABB50355.1 conserved hypothetical protein [Prochlorococcus marinus str. MIT 9312]KGF99947.1 hypothetical protein EU97_1081 [Prochlorococcus marinus str. MIT 9311]